MAQTLYIFSPSNQLLRYFSEFISAMRNASSWINSLDRPCFISSSQTQIFRAPPPLSSRWRPLLPPSSAPLCKSHSSEEVLNAVKYIDEHILAHKSILCRLYAF